MSCTSLSTEEHDTRVISSHLYSLVSSTNYGRHLIASKDIPAGTLILEEEPVVLGPEACSPVVCVGCLIPIVKPPVSTCSACGWPVCSLQCTKIGVHSLECSIFQKDTKKCGIPAQLGSTPRYDLILIARCLLLRDHEPQKWKALQKLESHANARLSDREPHQMAAVRYFSEVCKLEFNEEDLHRVRGVILTNAINTQTPLGVKVRGIYPTSSMLNHSCQPNITLRSNVDHKIFIYSSVAISKGEPLRFSYVPVTDPIWKRKLDLWTIYRFDCSCEICSDPTEQGHFLSSFRCSSCHKGYIVFKEGWNQTWHCQHCHFPCSFEEVANKCNEMSLRYFPENSINGKETLELISEALEATHCRHHTYFNVLQHYQQILNGTDLEALTARTKLWSETLGIISLLEPGLTRRRGLMLLQLASSLFKEHCLQPDLSKLRDAEKYITESMVILKLEPKDSTERKWIQAGRDLEEKIEISLKESCD